MMLKEVELCLVVENWLNRWQLSILKSQPPFSLSGYNLVPVSCSPTFYHNHFCCTLVHLFSQQIKMKMSLCLRSVLYHEWVLYFVEGILGIQGTYINTIKAINSKPTPNYWRETQSDSTAIRNKTTLFTLSLSNR